MSLYEGHTLVSLKLYYYMCVVNGRHKSFILFYIFNSKQQQEVTNTRTQLKRAEKNNDWSMSYQQQHLKTLLFKVIIFMIRYTLIIIIIIYYEIALHTLLMTR